MYVEKNEVSKSSSGFMMYIDLLCKASVVVLMHWAWSVLYFCKCYIGWKACDGVDNLYKANVLFFVLCHNYFDKRNGFCWSFITYKTNNSWNIWHAYQNPWNLYICYFVSGSVHINVFIYMFRFWDYFQFICDVKQRIR